MPKLVKERSRGLSSTQQTIVKKGMLRAREIIFPMEQHTSGLSNTKQSAIPYIQVAPYIVNRLYLVI